MFLTTILRMSVPMCGLALYKISSGPPCLTSSSITKPILGSLVPVVSFPSEKAPAPPSPNWTFDSVSRIPSFQNLSTCAVLVSTSIPRSRITGFKPALASTSPANIPQGPNPTTTGGLSECATGISNLCLSSGSKLYSTEYTNLMSFLFLASMDSLTILQFLTFLPVFLCIFAGRSEMLSPGLSLI